jgi:hypothetical protein
MGGIPRDATKPGFRPGGPASLDAWCHYSAKLSHQWNNGHEETIPALA